MSRTRTPTATEIIGSYRDALGSTLSGENNGLTIENVNRISRRWYTTADWNPWHIQGPWSEGNERANLPILEPMSQAKIKEFIEAHVRSKIPSGIDIDFLRSNSESVPTVGLSISMPIIYGSYLPSFYLRDHPDVTSSDFHSDELSNGVRVLFEEGGTEYLTDCTSTTIDEGNEITAVLPGFEKFFFAKSIKNGHEISVKNSPVAGIYHGALIMFWAIEPRGNSLTEFDMAMLDWLIPQAVDFLKGSGRSMRATLVGIMTSFSLNKKREAEQELRNLEERRGMYFRELSALKEREQTLLGSLNAQSVNLDKLTASAGELENYLQNKNKHIKSYKAENDRLIIVVEGLVMKWGTLVWNMPTYRVEIGVTNPTLEIFLADSRFRVSDEYVYHPHVKTDGYVCLGNYTELWPKLVASGDMIGLIEIVIAFLTTYNASSPYQHIARIMNHYKTEGSKMSRQMAESIFGDSGLGNFDES